MSNNITDVVEASTRSGFFLTIGYISSMIISAVTGVIIARILGPELYGLYSITLVIPTIIMTLIKLGTNQSIMKLSASLRVEGKTQQLRKLLVHCIIFQATLALVAFVICFLFSNQLSIYLLQKPEVASSIQIISPIIVFTILSELMVSMYNSLDKTEYNTLMVSIREIARIILSLVLLMIGLGTTGAITGNVLSWSISCSLGLFFFIKILHSLKKADNNQSNIRFSDSLRTLIGFGLPIYFSNLIIQFIPQFLNILLVIFASNYEVGNYRAARNFFMFINSINLATAGSLLPAFSKLEKKGEEVKTFLRVTVKYISIIILPITILVIYYSNDLITTIYGQQYTSAPQYLMLSISRLFLIGFGYTILTNFFNGLGETKTNLKIGLITLIIIIFLAPILSWKLGTIGVVLTLISAAVIDTGMKLYVAKKKFNVTMDYSIISRIYLASITAAIILPVIQRIIPGPSIVTVTLGSVAYLALYLTFIPLVKIINPTELKQIKGVIQKIKFLRFVARPIIYYEEKILKQIHSKTNKIK